MVDEVTKGTKFLVNKLDFCSGFICMYNTEIKLIEDIYIFKKYLNSVENNFDLYIYHTILQAKYELFLNS